VVRFAAAAWFVLLFSGWLAATAETWRGAVRPRIKYPFLPAQLVRSFQTTGDDSASIGYPLLFLVHPDPKISISPVLADPRMQGKLPPSLQPELPMGGLSATARWLCRHRIPVMLLGAALTALLAAIGLRDLVSRSGPRKPPQSATT
jgi:hypothetical protein